MRGSQERRTLSGSIPGCAWAGGILLLGLLGLGCSRPPVVTGVGFADSGRSVAAADVDGYLTLWSDDVSTRRVRLRVHRWQSIWCMAVSPDGRYVATGGLDFKVKIVDVLKGAVAATLDGHGGYVQGVAFSPDGRYLVSASLDGTARIWTVPEGRCLYVLFGRQWVKHTPDSGYAFLVEIPCKGGVAFSPDGRWLAVGEGKGIVRVWDARRVLSGEIPISLPSTAPITVQSVRARFTKERIRDFLLRTRLVGPRPPRPPPKEPDDLAAFRLPIPGTGCGVDAVAFSPDGRYLLASPGGGGLAYWTLEGNQVTETGEFPGGAPFALSPDGERAAVIERPEAPGGLPHVVIRTLATRERVRSVAVSSAVRSLAYSPDGSRLAIGFYDATVAVLDVTSGKFRTQGEGRQAEERPRDFQPE